MKRLWSQWKIHIYAALFSIFVVAPTSYLVIDREPPFMLSGFETIPSEIVAGSSYRISLVITPLNDKACTGFVVLQVIDSSFPGRVWLNDTRISILTAQELGQDPVRVVGRPWLLPEGVRPGPARIKTRQTFYCNFTHWLWPITIDFPELLVTVLPPHR